MNSLGDVLEELVKRKKNMDVTVGNADFIYGINQGYATAIHLVSLAIQGAEK